VHLFTTEIKNLSLHLVKYNRTNLKLLISRHKSCNKTGFMPMMVYMPELPEVETIVRGLQRYIIGKQVSSVQVLHPKPLGKLTKNQFSQFLIGESFQAIKRHGKYIHFLCESGKSLVVHLRMTGKFIYKNIAETTPALKHIRLIFSFNDQTRLLFQDMRLFATFAVYFPSQTIKEIQNLGPDPFSKQITARWLSDNLKNKKTTLKAILLDQRFLSGLGNIYVCEALHKTGLNPLSPAQELTLAQANRLIQSLRSTLKLALKYNGTTIRDFSGVDRKSGQFQRHLRVYGKNGELCPTCLKANILRIKQNGRSTFFCPYCQPL
jgi:formamidopyrimidine-DNA glycosylase